MTKKNILISISCLFTLFLFGFIALQAEIPDPEFERTDFHPELIKTVSVEAPIDESNAIQVALLLDTSGSMDGLIEQAKSQLWNILNVLARTEKGAGDTRLEIALYEYGNPSSATSPNEINQLTGFTSDMDMVSEKLFALTTAGGEEYCGAIIGKSLEDLVWTNADALKLIYIAGNEGFDQGPVDYKISCGKAKDKNIFVNTIFCGNDRIGGTWRNGAKITDGEFFTINANKQTAYIETPFDDEIDSLNQRLNQTYIPMGNEGNVKLQNQHQQDLNASKYGKANAADRASYKSSKKYKAESWDLVDAYKKDKQVVNKNQKFLEQKYQDLSIEELEAEIEKVSAERIALQEEIQILGKKRRVYIEAEKKNENTSDDNTLQNSIIKSIVKQASLRGFVVAE